MNLKMLSISFFKLFLTIFAFYITVLVLMYSFQRSIMYHPVKENVAPEKFGLIGMQDLRLKTSDNISVQAWYKAPKENGELVLYFHGNAGNLSDRFDKFSAFLEQGYGVLGLSYRGFGTSEGTPSEEGIYQDARAAIEYIKSQNIDLKRVVIFGESLGTGVAVQMATENNFKAIVLEAPYTSVANRAQEMYWFLPVKLLLKDHFNSIKKIPSVKTPVLVIHGEQDVVIPKKHGEKIFAAAPEPKKLVIYSDTGHSDFDSRRLVQTIKEFTNSLSSSR